MALTNRADRRELGEGGNEAQERVYALRSRPKYNSPNTTEHRSESRLKCNGAATAAIQGLFEIKALFTPELITSFARIDGGPVGIVASQSPPKRRGITLV